MLRRCGNIPERGTRKDDFLMQEPFYHDLDSSTHTDSLTWDDLVREEPRLARLEADIRQIPKPKDKTLCANAIWFGYPGHEPGYKNRLVRLVGWYATNGKLTSDEAYDTAYRYLYELVPDCQHDGGVC